MEAKASGHSNSTTTGTAVTRNSPIARPTSITITSRSSRVFRYDRFNQLHTPVGFDEQRWSIGLNYWVTPSAVLKLAYEFDVKNGGARNQDAFLMQAAVG